MFFEPRRGGICSFPHFQHKTTDQERIHDIAVTHELVKIFWMDRLLVSQEDTAIPCKPGQVFIADCTDQGCGLQVFG